MNFDESLFLALNRSEILCLDFTTLSVSQVPVWTVRTALTVLSTRNPLFDDCPSFMLLDSNYLFLLVSYLIGFYPTLLPLYQFLNIPSNQSEGLLVLSA